MTGPEGGENIAKLLKENFYVTDIDVSHNKIQSQGCFAFCDALNENTTVKTLSLAWNELKNRDAIALAETMKINHTLMKFDLSGNGFEEDAGMNFGRSCHGDHLLILLTKSDIVQKHGFH